MTKLLLADDAENNTWTLSALLEDEGFEVDVVRSCAAVRARLRAAAASYSLVLLDQHLGDGLGSDLVPLLRERHPATRIVMMSGNLQDERFADQADGCFEKGGDFTALLAVVRSVMG